MLLRLCRRPRPLRLCAFRGSIARPTQSLCTLRDARPPAPQHSPPGGRYPWAGLPPAGTRQLVGALTVHLFAGTLQLCFAELHRRFPRPGVVKAKDRQIASYLFDQIYGYTTWSAGCVNPAPQCLFRTRRRCGRRGGSSPGDLRPHLVDRFNQLRSAVDKMDPCADRGAQSKQLQQGLHPRLPGKCCGADGCPSDAADHEAHPGSEAFERHSSIT